MRRRLIWTAVALLVIAGGAYFAYRHYVKAPGDVSNPDVEFKEQGPPKRKPASTGIDWPVYGFTPERTRYMPEVPVHPPYRLLWRWKGRSLIEFQPVYARGRLYVLENDGRAVAISARTGKVAWQRQVGRLAASSPAWDDHRVYLVANNGGDAGIASATSSRVWCLDGRTGKPIWTTRLASASESSPVVAGGRVYLGSQRGTVYALDAKDGGVVWRHEGHNPVKAAPAYSAGRLFVGEYGGHVTALRASNGSVMWRKGTSGRSFGRAGNFYATPAVAFGRVYAGNTDGFVYSFGASDGKLAWRHGLGGYVYAAPAVTDIPGMRPAVFTGSYSGKFVALDARSGDVLWTFRLKGKISGAPSVIGRIVYFSNLATRTTAGLDARTGRQVFRFHRGAFNPAISDGRRLFLTGYSSVYGFLPKDAKPVPRARKATRKKSSRSTRAKRRDKTR